MRSERWAALLLFTGCLQQVNLNPMSSGSADSGCSTFEITRFDCPSLANAQPHSFSSIDDVSTTLTRRWAFCGGARRTTGRGPLKTFFGGAGIELWNDGAALRFAFLEEDMNGYQRRQEAWATGTVRIETAGDTSNVVLIAADGIETSWAVQHFDDPNLLRNSTFDTWDFVPVD